MTGRPATRVVGWRLSAQARHRLLALWPARYPRVVGDHVTLTTGAEADDRPPPVAVRVIGRADDGSGVEALVVEIDGAARRPDGGTFHITWSLGHGREAVEINAVLARHGWAPTGPEPVDLTPASFESQGKGRNPRTAGSKSKASCGKITP